MPPQHEGNPGIGGWWSRPPASRTSPVLSSYVWFNAEISIFSCLTKQAQRQIPLFVTPVIPCTPLSDPLPSCLALCSMGRLCPPLLLLAGASGLAYSAPRAMSPARASHHRANNVLSSGQEILWHPLCQALSPAAFYPKTEASLRAFFTFWQARAKLSSSHSHLPASALLAVCCLLPGISIIFLLQEACVL